MSANKTKNLDIKILSSVSKAHGENVQASLKSLGSLKEKKVLQSLKNPNQKLKPDEIEKEPQIVVSELVQTESTVPNVENLNQTPVSYSEQLKQNKKQKTFGKEQRLLSSDRLTRDGHSLTYIGIFIFTLVLYFRPYEWISGLSGFDTIAEVIAIATLLIYLPTQITKEGSLSVFTTEVKCILIMVGFSILSIPIAKDPGLAWKMFYENFSKVALIFIVMLNVLQTRRRLLGLMWLAIAISVWLSYQAVLLYREGVFNTEGYRVSVNFGGMFGNSNDMALFLAITTPISIALGLASKYKLSKLLYFVAAGLMITGNFVTQSRGAFLGLIAMAAVFVWKLGKKQRFKSVLISSVVGALVITLAPGNYWLRILSIFVPSLDPSGSSDQRTELLIQSIWVTLRNPLGIGIGNFRIVGTRNLETHNAFTQISSEIGLLALVAYVILMISPLRKLAVIERQMIASKDFTWTYFLSIGVQASIITYMVSSFFGSVAYTWYVYYLIAYAVCLRRIYRIGKIESRSLTEKESSFRNYFKLQKA
ncbi:MAG: O-antigen ligase family protein [Pyrinomonadaceae bacterium]